MKIIAFRSTWRHAVLEHLIKELDPNQDLSRSAVTIRAIREAENVEDWKYIRESILNLERLDIPVAVSMQANIDDKTDGMLKEIQDRIWKQLHDELDLTRLQTPYLVQLLWMNYLLLLKERKMRVGSNSESEADLTGPDMVKKLVQILLLNRECDKEVIAEVKNALQKWRE